MKDIDSGSHCPFCKSALSKGAIVCPSCHAEYGIRLGKTIVLREVAEQDYADLIKIAFYFFAINGAIFIGMITLQPENTVLMIITIITALLIPISAIFLVFALLQVPYGQNNWHR